MRKNSSAAVHVSGLRVIRGGNEVIPGLDLEVPRGALVGLLGPSGGGKSTLMRSIVGAQIIAGGDVTVLGEAAGSANLRRRVGYVTQSPSVYSDLTARENLDYFGSLVDAPKGDVARVLREIDLEEHADRPVSRLSGGQASRVNLGAALIGRPELLILDEPTVGLDPVLRQSLWNLFRRLSGDGATLVVSSHVMDEATRCDRLLLMRHGHIIADGTLDSILKKTKTKDAESAFLALAGAEEAA